jgi:hypothetical protein
MINRSGGQSVTEKGFFLTVMVSDVLTILSVQMESKTALPGNMKQTAEKIVLSNRNANKEISVDSRSRQQLTDQA